jgi:hypothetical protein
VNAIDDLDAAIDARERARSMLTIAEEYARTSDPQRREWLTMRFALAGDM